MALTRAAEGVAAACSQMTQPDILGVVLCHAHHMLGPREVCSLLCTSKATAACLSHHMQGQLQLKTSPRTLRQTQQLYKWLIKHSKLLQSLEFAPRL